MTWKEAIIKIMEGEREPIHYAKITEKIMEKGLKTTSGQTPENTVNQILSTSLGRLDSPFEKTSQGTYILKEKQSQSSTINAIQHETEDKGILTDYIERLRQFYQIILQGPPGTGKTYTAKKITKDLVGSDWEKKQGKQWEIIQFHPSYNYEDFVRGIQIKTEKEKVVYETVERILAKMAHKANSDPGNPYILIIDEINRANVAAVLGELIYALEYREKSVRTTYEIDGKAEITLPKNLYIIGTMNTADRTIGQIDYAVRRRFAFVTFLPDREVIKTKNAKNAIELFDMVKILFEGNEFLSPDYHTNDVAIGHSYFLADTDEELKNKVKCQVIPILEEYVKDGVLLQKAKEKIEEIGEFFDK